MNKKQRIPKNTLSTASKFGQMIGEAFEKVVIKLIKEYLQSKHSEYELLEPEDGRVKMTLELLGGNIRQLDTVITALGSADPIALIETKWLKDARHHNDKGSWILQLREMKKKYSTVRGATAVLAGYWTDKVGVMFMSEGGIEMVVVATDKEVYSTLQKPLDEYLGERSFQLDPKAMRISYERPQDLANLLLHLKNKGQLERLAASWLTFTHKEEENENSLTGQNLIENAIDRLLKPLPSNPQIKAFEITLEVDTGNIIHEKFEDVESAIEFIKLYFRNSDAILDKIKPKRKVGQQKLPLYQTKKK